MTDEMIEAVARAIWEGQDLSEDGDWEITKRVCGKDNWEVEECYRQARAAIKAHCESLAKAGLGIRPREPTVEMINGLKTGQLKDSHILKATYDAMCVKVYQAMWDAHPDKPDGCPLLASRRLS